MKKYTLDQLRSAWASGYHAKQNNKHNNGYGLVNKFFHTLILKKQAKFYPPPPSILV